MKGLSAIIIRYAFVILFLWFGFQQLLHPEVWVSFLPNFLGYFPIPAEMIVQLNGWLEIILAVMLGIGIYTRIVFTVLGLHVLGIAVTAGGAIGMRDFMIGITGIALGLADPDDWTFDAITEKKKMLSAPNQKPS